MILWCLQRQSSAAHQGFQRLSKPSCPRLFHVVSGVFAGAGSFTRICPKQDPILSSSTHRPASHTEESRNTMTTEPKGETRNLLTPEQFRKRLKTAFSSATEEDRRRDASIEQVGKMAFIQVVHRVIATIGAVEERLEHENANPIWATVARDFSQQAHRISNAVTFLAPESMATTQNDAASSDPATELQKAFEKHLGEPFDHHSALDHFDAATIEEISRLALLKAVNRAIASIAAIEERLDCEKSNPIWATYMRDFLEHAQYASQAIEMTPPMPAIQGHRPGR